MGVRKLQTPTTLNERPSNLFQNIRVIKNTQPIVKHVLLFHACFTCIGIDVGSIGFVVHLSNILVIKKPKVI